MGTFTDSIHADIERFIQTPDPGTDKSVHAPRMTSDPEELNAPVPPADLALPLEIPSADSVPSEGMTRLVPDPAQALNRVRDGIADLLTSRPDLSDAVREIDQAVDALAQKTGLPAPMPSNAGNPQAPDTTRQVTQVTTWASGDPVNVSSGETQATGVILQQNPDGTYEVLTEAGTTLQKVPVEAIRSVENGRSPGMELPTKGQPTTASDANPPNKPYDMNPMRAALIKADSLQVKEGQSIEMDGKTYFVVHVGHEWTQLRDEASGDRLKVFPGELREDLESGHAVIKAEAGGIAAAGFNTWLDTFISEKGIDLEHTFDVEGPSGTNTMPYGVIIEHMKIAGPQEQKALKNKLVYLDFKNADIKDFLRHLGGAIAAGVVSDASIMGSFKKTLKASVKAAVPADFKVGDHIKHDLFGEGVVSYVGPDQISVTWDNAAQSMLGAEPLSKEKLASGKYKKVDRGEMEFSASVKASLATVTSYDSVVTQESSEEGDIDHEKSDGPEDGDVREFTEEDVEEEGGLPKAIADYLKRQGASQASSSDFHPGVWYETGEDQDYKSGDSTTTSFHIKGLTEEQERHVWDELKKMKVLASVPAKWSLRAAKEPKADFAKNFKKMDGEGTAYKHNQSGEVIYKNNGTWRVIRKDKSKGSLGNGEDMYHPENLNLAMKDVHERMKGGVEATAPTFNKWLDTFISEKSIDPEQYFEVTGPSGPNDMPYGVVIEHMKIASPQEQAALKDALVMLDFKGADAEGIKKYLRHLSQAIAASSGNGGQVMGTDIKAAWRDWKTAKGVEVVTKDKGVQTFDSLEDAKKVYPELDPEKNTKQFTWAQRGAENRMRFEDWATEELMSASVKAKRFRLTAGVHEVGKTYTYSEPNGQKFDFSVDENGDRTLSPWEGGAALVLRDSEGDGDKINEILSLVDGFGAAALEAGRKGHGHGGVIKRGGKFIVVSKEGKVLGKHDNREDADKQVAAIKFRQGTIHSRIYAETSLEKVDALIKEHPEAFKKVVEENKGRAAEERAEAKKALDTLVTEGEKDPKVKKSDRFRKRRAWLTSKAETSDEDFGKQMFLYHWMRAHGKSSVGYLDGPARKRWEDLTGKKPSEKDEYKIPTFHEQAMAAALWARRGFKANLFSTLDSSSSVIELLRRAYREAKKGNPDHGSQFVSEAIEKAKADLKPEQEKLAREFKDDLTGGDFERMKTRIHSMESIGATNAKISTLEAELVPEIDFSVSPSEIIIKAGKGYAELAETVASGENAFEKELSLVEDIRSKDRDLIFLTSDAFAMDPRSKAFTSLQAGVQEMLVRLAEDGGVNDVKWEAVYPWPYDLFKKLSETGEIVLKAILPSSVESSIVPQEAVMSKENEIKAAAIAAKAKRLESIQGRLKAEILAAQGGTDAAAPQIYTFRAGLRVSKIVAHLKSLFPNLNADKDGKISIAADAVKTEVPAILQATTQYLRAALRPYPMEVDGKKYVVMTDIEENDGRKEWVPYEIKDEAGIGIEDPKEHEKIHLRFMDDDSSGKVEGLLFDPAIDAATEPKAAEGAGGTHTEPPKPVTPAEVPSAEAGAVVTPPAVSAAEPPKPNTPPIVSVVPKPVTSGDGKVTVNQGSTQVTVTPAALPADASVGEGLGQVPASDSNGATLEPPSKDPIKDLASAVATPAQIQASVFDSVPEVKFGEGWVVRRKKAQAKGAGIKSALHASTRAYPYIIQTLTGELYQVKADGIMESLPAGAGMQAAFDRGVLGVVIDVKVLPESIRSVFAAEGGEAGGAASKDKPKAEKIEVVDAEGKVKDTLPDAFGDNAEDVAALFVKLYPESKKKEEGGGKKGEGEAKLANKPKELPIIDVKPEEEAALKSAALALESHIEAGRRVIELMIDRGTLVAETKDVKAFQMAGHGLQAAIDKAFEAAISRKRLDLERMPAHQIEAIQAGLERMPSIEASMESTIQAEAKKLYSSARGLNAIDGLTVEANDGRLGKRSGGTNIGAAFMRP
jgi:hypothetical protein